jgi:hypothetical protein
VATRARRVRARIVERNQVVPFARPAAVSAGAIIEVGALACGGHHTVLALRASGGGVKTREFDGALYACGSNAHGQARRRHRASGSRAVGPTEGGGDESSVSFCDGGDGGGWRRWWR